MEGLFGKHRIFMLVTELRAGLLQYGVLTIEVLAIKVGKQFFTDLFWYPGPVTK